MRIYCALLSCRLNRVFVLSFMIKVAAVAQEWANTLVLRGEIEHRPNNKYGENILVSWGDLKKSTEAVDKWYGEEKLYDYNKNTPAVLKDVGHFTQLVWKGTKAVGCGQAKGKQGTVIVCNYNPPGNVKTKYRFHVLPKMGS